jgi:hypothetical protein
VHIFVSLLNSLFQSLFYLDVTIDEQRHFVYLLSFFLVYFSSCSSFSSLTTFSLSFMSLFCLFPLFSLSFSLCFIYNDGMSTALHTRWRKMLGWLWINQEREMKSVFYGMLVFRRRGISRIFEYKTLLLEFRYMFVTFTEPRSTDWRMFVQFEWSYEWRIPLEGLSELT